jgi:hypothetical protein
MQELGEVCGLLSIHRHPNSYHIATIVTRKPKAGRTLEILTARIERAVSGSGVAVKSPDHLEDKVAGGTREVDVSLRTTVGSAEVIVIVECRDRGRAADVTWIEQIATKRDAVGASKAVAVSSGTFSKKALMAARAYGIDARTLNQVDRAEITRWAGNLRLFRQIVGFDYINITVTLGGAEPLSKEIAEQFDQLVRDKNFDSAFIALSGQEGLVSPREVLRRMQTGSMGAGAVTLTIPPMSAVVFSDDPLHIFGPAPADGTSVERQHTIEFADGDAAFGLGPDRRNLLAVRMNCSVRLKSSTPIEADAYRYASSRGVIEVAARTADMGGRQLNILEHRKVDAEHRTARAD